MAELKFKPQKGYQEQVLSSAADIVISGAAAGVGKTYTLLLDPIRDLKVPGFGGVIFRRTSTQIRSEGGLWDTSMTIYPYAGGFPKESIMEWKFKHSKLKFSHLEHEKNIFDWQGSQICYIGFDELTHFTRKMFFYMLSRNRSVCGVSPYIRATCNPDPESWVAEFILWWINQETGFPIPERNGIIRYLIVDGENYLWGDTEQEVIEKGWYLLEPLIIQSGLEAKHFIKTVTFISGSIYDNVELLKVNPGYLSNLASQDEATRMALLHGNWKVVLSEKDIYEYSSFRGLFDNVKEVDHTRKCITADIAFEGSNKFIVGYWLGFELMDIDIMDKSNGPQIIDSIIGMAKYYGVNNSDIVFDADGVGQFIAGSEGGFIPGAIGFHGGGKTLEFYDEISEEYKSENYFNLRAQCYYRSGLAVQRGDRKVNASVANKMYDDKMTIRQRMMHERKAIKKDDKTPDGKLKIISKDEMKAKINGDSPDILDMVMMREVLELEQSYSWVAM